MTITTKFGAGDQAYYLAGNGVIKNSKVIEVVTKTSPKNIMNPVPGEDVTQVEYRLQDAVGVKRPEGTLFPSAEELAANLVKPASESKQPEKSAPGDKSAAETQKNK